MTHTKGPWHYYDVSKFDFSNTEILISDGTGERIAYVTSPFSAKSEKEVEANARLISAAPKLLAGAEGLLKFLRVSLNAGPLSENPKEEIKYLEILRQAVNEAMGELK